MSKKEKTSPLFWLFIILIFLRVMSSISITYFYQDLYSLAFAFTYFVVFIGALLKKKAAYPLAAIIAVFDAVLGLTMTGGSFFTGAFLVDMLILVTSILLFRKEK